MDSRPLDLPVPAANSEITVIKPRFRPVLEAIVAKCEESWVNRKALRYELDQQISTASRCVNNRGDGPADDDG